MLGLTARSISPADPGLIQLIRAADGVVPGSFALVSSVQKGDGGGAHQITQMDTIKLFTYIYIANYKAHRCTSLQSNLTSQLFTQSRLVLRSEGSGLHRDKVSVNALDKSPKSTFTEKFGQESSTPTVHPETKTSLTTKV